MNVATYNILNPYFAERYKIPEGLTEGVDNWEQRKEFVGANIENSGAAVLCLQEVKESTLADLKKLAPSYVFLNPAMHRVSHLKAAHGVTIAYNPAKISLIRTKVFYSYPYDYYTGDFRGEIYADFYDAASKRTFRVASTHLLRYNPLEPNSKKKAVAKQEGFKQLQQVCENVESDSGDIQYIVIAGDFNEGFETFGCRSSRPKYLQRKLEYRCDGNKAATDKNTLRKIDWIFCKQCLHKNHQSETAIPPTKDKLSLQPLTYEKQNLNGSDHLMIGTTITVNSLDPDVKRSPRLKGFSSLEEFKKAQEEKSTYMTLRSQNTDSSSPKKLKKLKMKPLSI